MAYVPPTADKAIIDRLKQMAETAESNADFALREAKVLRQALIAAESAQSAAQRAIEQHAKVPEAKTWTFPDDVFRRPA